MLAITRAASAGMTKGTTPGNTRFATRTTANKSGTAGEATPPVRYKRRPIHRRSKTKCKTICHWKRVQCTQAARIPEVTPTAMSSHRTHTMLSGANCSCRPSTANTKTPSAIATSKRRNKLTWRACSATAWRVMRVASAVRESAGRWRPRWCLQPHP